MCAQPPSAPTALTALILTSQLSGSAALRQPVNRATPWGCCRHGPSFSYGSEANAADPPRRKHHWTLVFPSGRAGPGWEAHPATRTFCGHSPCYGAFWGTLARHLGGTRRAS